MKPNLFLKKKNKNEDQFTHSLAYVLNLFPDTIGKNFLSKIAGLCGKKPDFFGEFKEASFTGYEFPDWEAESRPDLEIITDRITLIFEVKLDAPLGDKQLERHYQTAKRKNSYLILVSNSNIAIPRLVLSGKNYLKPKNNPHFLWADLEAAFTTRFIRNKVEKKILEDFRHSLLVNGIKLRQIAGTTGNLYTNGSDAENYVLDKLKEQLKEIGFSAWRPRREYTLRVNPEKPGKYPLLNPRFYPSGNWLNDKCIDECLIIHCFEKESFLKEKNYIKDLSDLYRIFPGSDVYTGYSKDYHVVIFYFPMKFISQKDFCDLDWVYLNEIWQHIYNILIKRQKNNSK